EPCLEQEPSRRQRRAGTGGQVRVLPAGTVRLEENGDRIVLITRISGGGRRCEDADPWSNRKDQDQGRCCRQRRGSCQQPAAAPAEPERPGRRGGDREIGR